MNMCNPVQADVDLGLLRATAEEDGSCCRKCRGVNFEDDNNNLRETCRDDDDDAIDEKAKGCCDGIRASTRNDVLLPVRLERDDHNMRQLRSIDSSNNMWLLFLRGNIFVCC